MSRILYFDCFSGASGDMVLGALLDAGLPLAELRKALGSLAIEGASVSAVKVTRAGVAATKFLVRENVQSGSSAALHGGHSHDHGHSHGEHRHEHSHEPGVAVASAHPHRSLSEINATIDRSALSATAKARARELFQKLGDVEAGIHQIPVERIHLHEVGALDSIIDIVGAVFALEWFHADRIVSSPLNVGSGMVNTEHGVFPVPAPATLKLLSGVPIYSSGAPRELVTPTGALILSSYASAFGPIPAMKPEQIGYGAGDRDPADTPNVLRVLVGEEAADAKTEPIAVLECEIDDMNPQIFGSVMDKLYLAGALDVYFASVQMKKNRPGTLLTILARPGERHALAALVFRETTTIGIRHHEVERTRLDRQIVEIETAVGRVRFKIARLGPDIVNAAPEFDDCTRIAAERGIPVKDVQALAMKAYLEVGASRLKA